MQTFGRVAIHSETGVNVVEASSARLLATLVAGGREGISLSEVAAAFWTEPPHRWRTVLLLARRRLQSQLPHEWSVQNCEGHLRLVLAAGWVDAWRLLEDADQERILDADTSWIFAGMPFATVQPSGLLSHAAGRLLDTQYKLARRLSERTSRELKPLSGIPPTSAPPIGAELDTGDGDIDDMTRILLVGEGHSNHVAEIQRRLEPLSAANPVVIAGGTFEQAPLATVAAALPPIRDHLLDLDFADATSSARRAWRLVADVIEADQNREIQVYVHNAHLLDTASLRLVALLLTYPEPRNLRLVVAGASDTDNTDWSDLLTCAAAHGTTTLRTPATS